MIRKHKLVETMEGEGAFVKRLMPVAGLRNFDPFVLMDHFVLDNGLGFPTHPHRGFEGITYLFSGSMNHKDNMGNDLTIHAGGSQRFTAGSGMEHSEMPSTTQTTEGIQLWVNLSQVDKQSQPSYQQVEKDQIFTQKSNGVIRRTLVGNKGVIDIKQNIEYLDIEIKQGFDDEIINPKNHHQIIYVVSGEINTNNETVKSGEALLIDEATQLVIKAIENSRLIVLNGQAIGEPIIQYGPFVD